MANPVRQEFVNEPAATRAVLVDTLGIPYKASGGGSGGDVNITEVGGVPVTSPLPVSTDGLTDAELRATPVPVSGTVAVSNFPATQPVSAVNLDIRDLAFATDKVDVSGSVLGAVVSGTVAVSNFPATQPISAAALPLPSGASTEATLALIKAKTDNIDVALSTRTKPADAQHVIIDSSASIAVTGPLTDTELRASAVPVSAASLPLPSGAATAALQTQPGVDIGDVTINNAAGASAVNIQDGGNSITIDGTVTAVGAAAQDAAASGNPVLIAASEETIADSAPNNRVSAIGDVTRLSVTDGAVFVITSGPQQWKFLGTGVQAGAQVHAAPSSGLALYVTDITFSIGASTASSIKLLNNGGADIWGPHYLEAVNGRGMAIQFATPLKVTAATRLDVTTTGSATQTVNINGFIAPG